MPREAPVTRAIRLARGFVIGRGYYRREWPGQARYRPKLSFRDGAQAPDPESRSWLAQDNLWILRCATAHHSSRFARPGMTRYLSSPPPAATAAAVAARPGSGR